MSELLLEQDSKIPSEARDSSVLGLLDGRIGQLGMLDVIRHRQSIGIQTLYGLQEWSIRLVEDWTFQQEADVSSVVRFSTLEDLGGHEALSGVHEREAELNGGSTPILNVLDIPGVCLISIVTLCPGWVR